MKFNLQYNKPLINEIIDGRESAIDKNKNSYIYIYFKLV